MEVKSETLLTGYSEHEKLTWVRSQRLQQQTARRQMRNWDICARLLTRLAFRRMKNKI
jgi:hypothetical protein